MKFLRKIHYFRDHDGQFAGGISKLKAVVLLAVLGVSLAGAVQSVLFAPALNAKERVEESLTQAIENATWVTTGTQISVKGNVIMDEADLADAEAPAIYLGDDVNTLYKWHEWETKQLKKELENWMKKAGEPTAILTRVCRQNGVQDAKCPPTLYAMAAQESILGKAMTGDGGRSRGWFHIMDYHEVTDACALDLECSADWTLKRMLRMGFEKSRDTAIMLHNGTPNTPNTLRYLAAVNSKMALWPKK